MPTFVPSIFSSTINDSSAMNRMDSASLRCLSSSVPLEPNRWGVRGYLMKSPCEVPIRTPFLLSAGRWHVECPRQANRNGPRESPQETRFWYPGFASGPPRRSFCRCLSDRGIRLKQTPPRRRKNSAIREPDDLVDHAFGTDRPSDLLRGPSHFPKPVITPPLRAIDADQDDARLHLSNASCRAIKAMLDPALPVESSQRRAVFTRSQDCPDTFVRRSEVGHPVELAADFSRADEAELRAVLVDEFQDTNDRQRQIVYALTGFSPHPNPLPKGEGVAIPSPTVPELVEGGEG